MYLRGSLQTQIAGELNVTQATISRDLAALRKLWLQSALVDINEAKAKELAKIDNLELEYWAAWERSKLDAEIEVTEQVGSRHKPKKGEPPEPEGLALERIKKYKRVEGQSGNPAFLRGIEWCIQARRELFGLDAPKRTDVTSGGKPIENHVTDERFQQTITTLADALREIVPGASSKEGDNLGAEE